MGDVFSENVEARSTGVHLLQDMFMTFILESHNSSTCGTDDYFLER